VLDADRSALDAPRRRRDLGARRRGRVVARNQNVIAAATRAARDACSGVGRRRAAKRTGHAPAQRDARYPARFAAIGAAHRAFYDALVASNLEWTLVCTPNIVARRCRGAADRQRERAPTWTFQVTTARSLRFCCARPSKVGSSQPRRRVNGTAR